ncbi:MAG: aspartate aminotransferase family protein, partial [Bacteroidetes bacterium]
RLADQIENFAREKGYPLRVPHIASIFWLSFSEQPIQRADQIEAPGMEKFKSLHHELLQRGVYLGPSGYEVGFVSAAHSDADLDFAAEQICRALEVVFSV